MLLSLCAYVMLFYIEKKIGYIKTEQKYLMRKVEIISLCNFLYAIFHKKIDDRNIIKTYHCSGIKYNMKYNYNIT